MGARRSKLDHLSALDAAELHTRREISVLEELRNAARGELLSISAVIAHARALAIDGQAEHSSGLLETAVKHRRRFTNGDNDLLKIAKASLDLGLGHTSDAVVEALEDLVSDDDATDANRAQALLWLAELAALDGDYTTAASVLTPKESGRGAEAYRDGAVVVARAVYLNFAGDPTGAMLAARCFVETPTAFTPNQVNEGLVQYAWALTHLGLFGSSNDALMQLSVNGAADANVLRFIKAWNQAGAMGVDFGEAIRNLTPQEGSGVARSAWLTTFFEAWSAFAEGNLDEALGTFDSLRGEPQIESVLNGTREELARHGRAVTLSELGKYEDAHASFRQLTSGLHVRPTGVRFQPLMYAHSQGLCAVKLSSLSDLETVSRARRCAQFMQGLTSPVVPRLMDVEAELLLAAGRSTESRATRDVAIELVHEGAGSTDKDRLRHELGLSLVDVYDKNDGVARASLRTIIPKLHEALGWHHEKTVIARYALASLTEPTEQEADATDFEGLYKDLAHSLGPTHLLTLKARYGIARKHQTDDELAQALDIYKSVEAELPYLPQNLSFRVSVQRRIGEIYRTLRQYKAAQESFEAALNSLKSTTNPDSQRKRDIQLDNHECLLKRGKYRQVMGFFASTASDLRRTGGETTQQYFRAVHGYASCLEHLGNHQGSAHNYGHLVRLLDGGTQTDARVNQVQIYVAAAWNNELSNNFPLAARQYAKALEILDTGEGANDADSRRTSDIKHRLNCCTALLASLS